MHAYPSVQLYSCALKRNAKSEDVDGCAKSLLMQLVKLGRKSILMAIYKQQTMNIGKAYF